MNDKENIRITLKFTVGLPIIIVASVFLFIIWFLAWALGDKEHKDFGNMIKWLWKVKR